MTSYDAASDMWRALVVGGVASVFRGYAGSIRPVEAYDEVLSGGNIVVG